MTVSALILGCSGPILTDDERSFFRDVDPWGFILFRRNIEEPEQVSALTAALRDAVGREALILVDQEGGRVQRLRPPHWPKYPPARRFGELPLPFAGRRDLVELGARLIAHDLRLVGIDADCLPVLDVPVPGAHDVIGDRAYGTDPEEVAILGRAAAEGLLAGGVLPVMKHIPGHGRSMVDTHLDLPVVSAGLDELDAQDFRPFRALRDLPIAMTAHLIFAAIDPEAPATVSRKVIQGIVRGRIGYDGLLLSDDLSMQALAGTLGERARGAFVAGCDIGLHCNGLMAEMQDVAAVAPLLMGEAARRASLALARRRRPEPLDIDAVRALFESATALASA